jgi:hypothetical protein
MIMNENQIFAPLELQLAGWLGLAVPLRRRSPVGGVAGVPRGSQRIAGGNKSGSGAAAAVACFPLRQTAAPLSLSPPLSLSFSLTRLAEPERAGERERASRSVFLFQCLSCHLSKAH